MNCCLPFPIILNIVAALSPVLTWLWFPLFFPLLPLIGTPLIPHWYPTYPSYISFNFFTEYATTASSPRFFLNVLTHGGVESVFREWLWIITLTQATVVTSRNSHSIAGVARKGWCCQSSPKSEKRINPAQPASKCPKADQVQHPFCSQLGNSSPHPHPIIFIRWSWGLMREDGSIRGRWT